MPTQLHEKKVKKKQIKNKNKTHDSEKLLIDSAFAPAHIKAAGGVHTQKRSFKRTQMMQMMEAARSRQVHSSCESKRTRTYCQKMILNSEGK